MDNRVKRLKDSQRRLENWIIGNRKAVVEEILALPKAEACMASALLYTSMAIHDEHEQEIDCYAFITLLEEPK